MHGSESQYSTRRGALYASRCSTVAWLPTWICPFSRNVGTGMTTAKSFASPSKSLTIVSTVLSPLRVSTTLEAWLKSLVSALAT